MVELIYRAHLATAWDGLIAAAHAPPQVPCTTGLATSARSIRSMQQTAKAWTTSGSESYFGHFSTEAWLPAVFSKPLP